MGEALMPRRGGSDLNGLTFELVHYDGYCGAGGMRSVSGCDFMNGCYIVIASAVGNPKEDGGSLMRIAIAVLVDGEPIYGNHVATVNTDGKLEVLVPTTNGFTSTADSGFCVYKVCI